MAGIAHRVALVLTLAGAAIPAGAAVADLTPTDVTPRALSLAWHSDEAIDAATVRVYADANGTSELTGTLTIAPLTAGHANGIARVDVRGLAAATCYYLQAETTGPSGTVAEPAAPPFLELCTASATSKIDGSLRPLANDLILHAVDLLDDPVLVLLSLPGRSAYPVSTFAESDGFSAHAVLDMNNLYDSATGDLLLVVADEPLQLTEMRGTACGADPTRVSFGRARAHLETSVVGVPLVQVETPAACFFADTMCDGTIDVLDVQRVLNVLGAQAGDCRYHPDLDTVLDDTVNVLDVQHVLNRFGESEPFTP